MKNSRRIEILQMMIERIDLFYHGICGILYYLSNEEITDGEYQQMRLFLMENEPTPENQFKIFTQSSYWNSEEERQKSGYWWGLMSKYPITRQIRKNYLNQLIDTLK